MCASPGGVSGGECKSKQKGNAKSECECGGEGESVCVCDCVCACVRACVSVFLNAATCARRASPRGR